ncbi:YesL family protein [Erysipelothrix aquatica]|uniref:YesL family protein n=1 Tax=Erysipelothrix aquatica TaxID=2683714 RepID=UPI00135C0E12|nr:DUF624 domain-containing protein [Erysipelothrix aquatica]
MGTYVSDFFDRIYVLIKLSLMFWIMTMMGGVVLGIGPAFSSVVQLYTDYEWTHRDMHWKQVGTLFVSNFKRGNMIFYTYFLIIAVLAYNMYLAVQIKGIAILFVQFLIAAAFVLTICAYLYAILIDNNFEISYKNLLKLSAIAVMGNFFSVLKLLLAMIVVGFITSKYMGLLPFLTIGMITVLVSRIGKPMIVTIDEHIG